MRNALFAPFAVEDYQLTLFPDGRAIIPAPTTSVRPGLYARYIGH